MYGEWISDSHCKMYLIIDKNNHGIYSSHEIDNECMNKSWSGTVRYTNSHLYFGHTKFKFEKKPELLDGTDSVYKCKPSATPYNNCGVKYAKTATMTLKNSIFHSSEVITYYKIVDY